MTDEIEILASDRLLEVRLTGKLTKEFTNDLLPRWKSKSPSTASCESCWSCTIPRLDRRGRMGRHQVRHEALATSSGWPWSARRNGRRGWPPSGKPSTKATIRYYFEFRASSRKRAGSGSRKSSRGDHSVAASMVRRRRRQRPSHQTRIMPCGTPPRKSPHRSVDMPRAGREHDSSGGPRKKLSFRWRLQCPKWI